MRMVKGAKPPSKGAIKAGFGKLRSGLKSKIHNIGKPGVRRPGIGGLYGGKMPSIGKPIGPRRQAMPMAGRLGGLLKTRAKKRGMVTDMRMRDKTMAGKRAMVGKFGMPGR